MKKRKLPSAGDSLKYPLLLPKQKDSSVIERRVRRCLNKQTPEGDEEARNLLSTISPDKRNGEYYFLSGCLRHRMGHLTDALAYLDRACELSQGKIPEYENVRDAVRHDGEPTPEEMKNFAVIDETGQPYRPRPAFVFWNFTGECCIECCCDCTCEACCESGCEICGSGCCEGGCEACCSGCCEGCSCDC